MKLVSLFFFLFSFAYLAAKPLDPDTLLLQLQRGNVDAVIADLTSSADPYLPQEEVLLLLAYYIKDDSAQSTELRADLLAKDLSNAEAKNLIHFVFKSGYKFVTNRSVFYYIQNLGIDLSKKYDEPRAQFSFLQQIFSMDQMTNQVQNIPTTLREMRQLGQTSDYLMYQTDMQHSLYYCGLQHDSCTYYFEKYYANAKNWLGKPNPFFLNVEGYTLKKDSSILAGAITEYAKYFSHKGDLKKAGELFITSLQLLPDTSTVVLQKIRTQLALADIYANLVNPSRALLYIEKSIALCEKNKLDRLRKTIVASAYANALIADGQFDKAAVELQTAYKEYPRNLNCQDPKREAFRSAFNAAMMNDYALCKTMLDTAEAISCKPNEAIYYYQAMAHGVFAAHKGSYNQATLHFSKALQNAKKSRSIGWVKEVLYQEYLCYKQFGKTKESMSSLESYAHVKDSLHSTGQDVALFDIEAAYQKTIQDETIARLDAENEISGAKLSSQKRNLTMASIALTTLLVLLLLVWRLYNKIKVTNALLSKTVAEKNILLREIHHRVKNNLQVISSLLKLQSGYITDDAAIQAIAEGRSRVQSMALLHQNLYKEDDLKGVNMQEYFDNLIQGLFDTYNISADRIMLHKNIEAISLDVDTVVPLGLITNELISNALKHAFPGNTTGNLYVDLFEQGGNLILKVRDDGSGMTNSATKEGFGNKLIQSLSQKLEADITTRSILGTEITLTIREYRKAA